ncbi:ATP-binding protein [Portibacter marinus]|uniref:ATP-binding protein n=1 Tax=Portibacter marinus TaxID=2898660 RepID=UPI001F3AA506|nr:ATP-binding protein [Portibacter marinus]
MYPTELILKSDPGKIIEVEYFVKRFAKDLKINERIYPNILISVTEAVNNAIIHGNRKNKDKEVKIELHKENGTLTIQVSDQGDGFDPDDVPDPTLEENLEKLGGRGVFLIQQLSDIVSYRNNGRTVEMQFYL